MRRAAFLFAGGGLVEVGLRGLVRPVLAVELDREIAEAHDAAFPDCDVLVEDVNAVRWRDFPGPFRYLHASPVCKSYSATKIGRCEVESDLCSADGVVAALRAYRPGVFSLENVPEYARSCAWLRIASTLDELGYRYDERVYDAADYGVPSHRLRFMVRAVRYGPLPPVPKKLPRRGWWSAVSDLVPLLPESEVPDWLRPRFAHHGIDPGNIDRPLWVAGGSTNKRTIPHAWGDDPAPTIKATPAEKARILTESVFILPGGEVRRIVDVRGVSPRRGDGARVLARLMGVPDDYPLPADPVLASKIVGNGVPPPMARAVYGPLVPHGIADALLERVGIDPAEVPVVVTPEAARAPAGCIGHACTRQYAFTRRRDDGQFEFGISPKLLQASPERVAGILAHEVGHLLLWRSGNEHHSEREADAAAERALNVRISYDSEDVQTIATGRRPRPAYLG